MALDTLAAPRARRPSLFRIAVTLALPLLALVFVRYFSWPVAPLISILWLIGLGMSERWLAARRR